MSDGLRVGTRAPFTQVPDAVQDLGVYVAGVYWAIARRANSGQQAWPSLNRIAADAGVSRSTVQRALPVLRDAGWLSWERQASPSGGHDRNLYTINEVAVPPEDATTPRVTVTPPQGHPDPTPRVTETLPQGHSDPRTITNELDTDELDKDCGAPDGTLALVEPERSPAGFDQFWQTYPRKEGKGHARKAWKAATKKADPLLIIAGAARYAHDPNRVPAFTKHPSTWLNAESWGDEPLPPRSGGKPSTDEKVSGWLSLATDMAALDRQREGGTDLPPEWNDTQPRQIGS